MECKAVSKPTQKKVSVFNEKMQKKSANPATANAKRKKKNNRKTAKPDARDGDQNDGDHQIFGIEGIGVLDNTAGDARRNFPESNVVGGSQESINSIVPDEEKDADNVVKDDVIKDVEKDDVAEVTVGAITLPQVVKPVQPAPSPSDTSNMPQRLTIKPPQKSSAKVANRLVPQSSNQRTVNNNNRLPKSASASMVNKSTLESLRWDKVLENEDEEEERIRIYKMNRRKRYLAAAQAKGLGWVADYRNNGSPMSEDSGIDTKDRDWNNSSSTSDTYSAKSNSARSNKSRRSLSGGTHPTLADYGTIHGLGPSHYAGLAKSALVDC